MEVGSTAPAVRWAARRRKKARAKLPRPHSPRIGPGLFCTARPQRWAVAGDSWPAGPRAMTRPR